VRSLKFYINKLSQINFSNSFYNLKKCDVLFFCHDVDRGLSLNGLAFSPILDSVRMDFETRGLRCLTISHPWSILINEKGFGKPVAMNGAYFIYRLLKLSLNKLHLGNLMKNFSIYSYIFKKTSPKLIITIGSPDELCFEARKEDIYHAEILHGIGITFITWGWDKKEYWHLPQCILSLDDISTKTYSPLCKHGLDIKTIPHPFLKKYFGTNFENNIPKDWQIQKKSTKKYKKEILISLNWGYYGDHPLYSNILENGLFFNELEDVINDTGDIFWRLRLHPVQLRNKKYKNLRNWLNEFTKRHINTEWVESSTLPYPSVVKNCSGNITMNSFSCYDSASMGVKSLILCPTVLKGGIHEDWFLDLVKEGYAKKIQVSKIEIFNWAQDVEITNPRISNLSDDKSWDDTIKWLFDRSQINMTSDMNLSNIN
jgi:hypothetical protein